jgi:hypothetical protein
MYILFLFVQWGLLDMSATSGLFALATADNEFGTAGGMKIWQEKRRYSGKPCLSALFSHQVLHDMIWVRIRATGVRIRRLTTRARARP